MYNIIYIIYFVRTCYDDAALNSNSYRKNKFLNWNYLKYLHHCAMQALWLDKNIWVVAIF